MYSEHKQDECDFIRRVGRADEGNTGGGGDGGGRVVALKLVSKVPNVSYGISTTSYLVLVAGIEYLVLQCVRGAESTARYIAYPIGTSYGICCTEYCTKRRVHVVSGTE